MIALGGFRNLHSFFKKSIAKRSFVFLTTGFILYIIVAPSFLSAYQFNQVETNQLQSPTSYIDLNEMMLSSWKNWDTLLTRWLSLNGTLVDPYDYVRRNWATRPTDSNISLSGISFYSLALINMYEQTRGNYSLSQYYLSKLSTLIQGLIDNPFCYVTTYIVGVGNINIFHVPALYFSNGEHDYDLTPTMLTAFASLKLWKETHNEKFKQLADRVARESLLLAAVNNSTDLAWSRYYSWGREETYAKQLVWRQASITLFYTLYGKEINTAYLAHVNRTLNWQFRAQLPSGGLAASIGETAEDRANTGLLMFLLTCGYSILNTPYVGYRTNMTNTILWLQSLPIDFALMENYAVTSALINSWKANFTQVDINKTRTATYLGLKTLNFTAYGVFPKSGIGDGAYGWRWPQSFIGSFLSTYPLPDGTFQPSEIAKLIDYPIVSATDQDIVYQWRTNLGFDGLRINSAWGSGLYQWRGTGQGGTLYFFFGWKKDPPYETPVSIIDKYLYYMNVKSIYTSSIIDQQIYANGPATAQVRGPTTFSILQWSQSKVEITLANGTSLMLNDLVNSTLNLSNEFIIRQNDNPTHFFFIKSSNSLWTAYNQTNLLLLQTDLTDGRLSLIRLQVPNISASEAFEFFSYYATYQKQTPIIFTQMVDSYAELKNRVGEHLYGLPNWRVSHENATQKDVKLVVLSRPEEVNVSHWDFIERHLTAIISGAPGIDFIIKIYSGYRFYPREVFIDEVNLTQFRGIVWSYDSTTRTLTVNATFSSSSLKLEVFFTEDKIPPNILLVERLIQNPEYNDTVTVSANITDDESGVGTVLLSYWDGTYWLNTTMLLNSLYEGHIPPIPYATEVKYKVYAADCAENWISSEIYSYLVTDTYPPIVTILVQHLYPNMSRILRPADGDYVSGNANITVFCQEEYLEKLELYIDDALVKLWNKNGTLSYKWNTTALVEGSPHTLKLIANDLAGNSANTTATVFPDNTPPIIGSQDWKPRNPAPREDVTVTVSVTDATSGVEIVNLWYKNDTIRFFNQSMTFKDGVWSGVIPGHEDGITIEFFFEAYDKAGNRAQTLSWNRYHVGYSMFPIFFLMILAGILIAGTISAGVFVYFRKHRKIDKLIGEQSDIEN